MHGPLYKALIEPSPFVPRGMVLTNFEAFKDGSGLRFQHPHPSDPSRLWHIDVVVRRLGYSGDSAADGTCYLNPLDVECLGVKLDINNQTVVIVKPL